ncbi:Tripartite motif-containing protein 72 [Balamuthia mandrillaris]
MRRGEEEGEAAPHDATPAQAEEDEGDEEEEAEDEELEVFVVPPPEELKCAICFDLLRNPVITKECGHTFCQHCFDRSFTAKPTCPTCRAPFLSLSASSSSTSSTIFSPVVNPNRIVKEILDNLLIHCRYGLCRTSSSHSSSSSSHSFPNNDNKATTTSRRSRTNSNNQKEKEKEKEKERGGAAGDGEWTIDPNGCPEVIKRGYRRTHERACSYAPVRCTHRGRGCPWRGRRAELPQHLRQCPFDLLKVYINRTEEELLALRQITRRQTSEITLLKNQMNSMANLCKMLLQDVHHDTQQQQQLQRALSAFVSQEAHNTKEDDGTSTNSSEDGDERQHQLRERQLKAERKALKETFALSSASRSSSRELRCLRTLSAHDDTVESLVMDLDNGNLFSASWDHNIRVWDMMSPTTLASEEQEQEIFYEEHQQVLPQLVVTTLTCDTDVRELKIDGRYLYSGCGSGIIHVWDLEEWRCVQTVKQHADDVLALTVANGRLFSGSSDSTVRVWSLGRFSSSFAKKGKGRTRKRRGKDRIRALPLSSSSERDAVNGGDSNENDHDLDDDIDVDLREELLFSAVEDGYDEDENEGAEAQTNGFNGKRRKREGLRCIKTLTGHQNWVFALASCNNLVFSGSSDHTIKVWSADSLQCVKTLTGHGDQVRALCVSGDYLFSGSYDCTIKAQLLCFAVLSFLPAFVSLLISLFLFSQVWDIHSLECVDTMHVYNEVFGLGTAANFLFSGDENGTIKVWDLTSRRCIHTLSDHTGSVYAFAVGPHGRLLSASSDTTIKVWGR